MSFEYLLFSNILPDTLKSSGFFHWKLRRDEPNIDLNIVPLTQKTHVRPLRSLNRETEVVLTLTSATTDDHTEGRHFNDVSGAVELT